MLFVLLLAAIPAFAQKLTADEVIAKHLDSIGKAETRTGIQTIVMTGEATAKFLSQKDLVLNGRIVFASAGEKNFLGIGLNSNNYPGEQFIYDGKKAKVAFTQNGKRSSLGEFIQSNDLLLEDSLLSGVLSSSWVLSNLATKKSKLSFEGIKKINGKEVYMLSYSRKGSGDLSISLYFDKETFHHVRTEYKRVTSAGIGTSPDQSSKFSEVRFKVAEDFSDFKEEKGLTLPHGYRILYSEEGVRSTGNVEIEWTFNLLEFAYNEKLDPGTFNTDQK